MPHAADLLTGPVPASPADWMGIAVRPGSGLGFVPAALSVQPLATLATLLLAGAAALAVPRVRRDAPSGRRIGRPTA